MSGAMSKIYIAIIEDDEGLCRSMARVLRASNYEPVTYLSAEAYLGDEKHPSFDCLIVDIQLDGMSGIELGEQLQKSGVNTPVIFLTAHADSDELERKLLGSCAAFLRKSDPADKVLSVIQQVIHPE